MTDHELPRDLTEADIEAILAVPYEPAPDGLPLTRHITAEAERKDSALEART
jgi:hypothetical protein